MLYEEGPQGAEATGLRMTKAGKEQIVEADVYVAALDVPGAPSPSPVRHTASVCSRPVRFCPCMPSHEADIGKTQHGTQLAKL